MGNKFLSGSFKSVVGPMSHLVALKVALLSPLGYKYTSSTQILVHLLKYT